jgi:hypothetical protein
LGGYTKCWHHTYFVVSFAKKKRYSGFEKTFVPLSPAFLLACVIAVEGEWSTDIVIIYLHGFQLYFARWFYLGLMGVFWATTGFWVFVQRPFFVFMADCLSLIVSWSL